MSYDHWINVVLFEPEIPANTGNIGRLCVGLKAKLHLIEPLGFSLDEKEVKRAGLDYWKNLELQVYRSLEDFFEKNPNINFYFASTKATKSYTEVRYEQNDYIFFGKETAGLPEKFHNEFKDKGMTIPMSGLIRSINLSNSCAVVLYEVYRQLSDEVSL
ncbi:MAG: tRNA (uridine(34)/cytosine(34)/5-carboxymethylaminomethyluridine(34)-2'-O)-methyltransferase TrmL [Candidatus Delongbacteria bacterium]|nr:tRNA (uridine(34)/cytosine(34)/5-carboxymethylaminomethyluridine(34)-2'-O)-methyltransferase TrmL [Candidatus Delongbacteria bacterium]